MERNASNKSDTATERQVAPISSGAAPESAKARRPQKAPEAVQASVAKPVQEGPRATGRWLRRGGRRHRGSSSAALATDPREMDANAFGERRVEHPLAEELGQAGGVARRIELECVTGVLPVYVVERVVGVALGLDRPDARPSNGDRPVVHLPHADVVTERLASPTCLEAISRPRLDSMVGLEIA